MRTMTKGLDVHVRLTNKFTVERAENREDATSMRDQWQ